VTEPEQSPVPEETPSVRVFGKRTAPLTERRYRRFGLEVETDADRFVEEFDAYFDPDAGAILGMMNARTDVQQANATALLLRTSLRDDDGVPADWRFPTDPVLDDDGEPVLYALDPAGEPEEAQIADDEEVPEGVEPRYEWHDGELLTQAELRDAIREFDPLDEGSSRRRFEYVMNSPRHRVQLDALTELSEWITGDVAKRPTRKPSSSRRGQGQTGRTSRGSSHGRR